MFDLAQTDQLLTTTRSVRRRLDLDRPVERSVLLDCVRIAVQAPTGGNAQSWRWLVIDDGDTKTALGDLYQRMASRYLGSYRSDEMSDQTSRVLDSADHLATVLGQVPAMVVPCIKGRLTDTSPISAASFYGSILPAVWSFQLALRSRGLGSCFTTLHLAHEAEARDLLGIPDDATQVALLPVAYTTGGDFSPAERGPVEHITYWNRWKA
ncbi:MAG: nitroreductase family protein [Acidimicrobiales bacterium]